MIIISATTQPVALVGCYTYYVGMDLVMLALIRFTNAYCPSGKELKKKRHIVPVWVNFFLAADVIQMFLNPIFGHAFTLEEVEAYGAPYFKLVPLLGQTYHRLVCYGALAIIMIIFAVMSLKSPKVYRERYIVILICMVVCTLWQTFYIFSGTPVDRSMIGFAVFGLLIYYFSLYFRPLRLLDGMLADIVSDMNDAVFLYGLDGKCIWANEPGKALTKTSDKNIEQAGAVLSELFGDFTEKSANSYNEFTIGTGEDEKHYQTAYGSFNDSKGKELGSYLRVRDTTLEKRRMEMEIFATNHDALTGVYTKEFTFKKISDRIKQKGLKDYLIVSINIVDFKMFNDVFGRDFGDYALIQIADWIRKYSDERCIYGRMSGDTFGSCLPKELFIPDVIEQDLKDFKVKRGNISHHINVHLGIYEVDDADEDVSIMFDRSFLALDSIRDDFKRHVAFFDREIRDKVLWNQEISSQLGTAIEENQVLPYLQPIADRNGKIVGAEALARWIHPQHGFMSPAAFIPLFEENGMIVDLDKHIWRSACRILAGWKETHPDLFISVNVSPKDFYTTDVFADIRGLVREYDIDPKNLRIEVTETSMMRDTEEKMRVLEDFRKLGFIVEMDDFGSGYSSLNMLKDMPVDVLKIDMKFLGKSNDEDRANIIVKNVINLSLDLGITSLTEGVETPVQFDMLSKMGCILFQGYYFSKPVPLAEFEAMLKDQ
jgi:diguanylate cyclase (GGDEF)-like protein